MGEEVGIGVPVSVGASVGIGVWLRVIDAVICGEPSPAAPGVMEAICTWVGWLLAQAVRKIMKMINKNRERIPGIIQASA